jgi:hypothetical protein
MKRTNFRYNKRGLVSCDLHHPEYGIVPNGLTEEQSQEVIDSGVDIAEYIEPVKTIEQLQSEAVSAMESIVLAECRSGTGKLYFSNLNSAARHQSELIQPDSEIRDRAISLLQWDIAMDAYALSVVFSIESGGDIPTIESFIEGMPKI